MPDGLTHERFRKSGRIIVLPLSIITSVVLLKTGIPTIWSIDAGVGIVLGYESGRWITPDWDIMGTTSSEGWMVNELPVVGHFLFGISSTYGSIFRKHHRSFITHFPFVSTSIRYLLLYWWAWYIMITSTGDLTWLACIFIGIFIGLSFSDAIHWYLDMIHYPKSE